MRLHAREVFTVDLDLRRCKPLRDVAPPHEGGPTNIAMERQVGGRRVAGRGARGYGGGIVDRWCARLARSIEVHHKG